MSRELTRSEIREIRIKKNRIRRQRQLRRRLALFTAILIIILCTAFSFTAFMSKAQENSNSPVKSKCYDSIMIEYGSSLYDIATKYCDTEYYDSYDSYIKEIMFINHLNNSDIKAGHYLVIPYYTVLNDNI